VDPSVVGDELERFEVLKERLGPMFRHAYADPRAPRTVVVVPSLSLDPAELAKVAGVEHYEERQLSMMLWLRLPATRVVFVTSLPIDGEIVDYYLSLLSGVPAGHAHRRLTLLSTYDASPRPLTEKILDPPRLLQRVRDAIGIPRGLTSPASTRRGASGGSPSSSASRSTAVIRPCPISGPRAAAGRSSRPRACRARAASSGCGTRPISSRPRRVCAASCRRCAGWS
jgi:hypothetical protein